MAKNLVEAVLRLWDAGLDTQRIAQVLKEKQHRIERDLHTGLENRRREKERLPPLSEI